MGHVWRWDVYDWDATHVWRYPQTTNDLKSTFSVLIRAKQSILMSIDRHAMATSILFSVSHSLLPALDTYQNMIASSRSPWSLSCFDTVIAFDLTSYFLVGKVPWHSKPRVPAWQGFTGRRIATMGLLE